MLWDWKFWGRPEQLAPEGDWSIWLYLAGRGAGKTRSAAEWVREEAKYSNDGQRRFALVARTAADVRDVLVEGQSGIMAITPPSERPLYEPSKRRLTWPNGSSATCFTADEPDSLRGPQFRLDVDTPILTRSGWKTMGSLVVGDVVYDELGAQTNVTAVHPIEQAPESYRVTFSDGAHLDADAGHLWKTLTKQDFEHIRYREGKNTVLAGWATTPYNMERGDVATASQQLAIYELTKAGVSRPDISEKVGITIKQVKYWRKKFKAGYQPNVEVPVKSTAELRNTIGLRHVIPSTNAIEFPIQKAKLPLDPWVLGLVLGDGATRQPQYIASNVADIEDTMSELTRRGFPAIEKKHQKITAQGVPKLWGDEKCIPEEYFWANIEERTDLLRGLTDSDGTVTSSGGFQFCNTNKALIDGYVRLCVSLGLMPRVYCKKNPMRYGVPCKTSWTVHVYSETPLVLLPRKLSKIRTTDYRLAMLHRSIKSVERIPTTPMRCITVDSPSHLYLAGEALIPTHNTHAWADEVAAWRQTPDSAGMSAWDNLRVGTRLGQFPKIFATTTPKRIPLLYSLLAEAEKNPNKVKVSRGSTMDNSGNLSESYIDAITGVYAGTRLASQELYGEMLDAVEGALWTDELIAMYRENSYPSDMPLRVIGVDPSVAENPTDECGIVVLGSTAERDLYKRQSWVLEDASVLGSPTVWAQRVVAMARKWGCPVVAEVNQGGSLVKAAIHTIDPSVKVFEVHSKFGKALRAEPVTLAYEQGRVHHVGYFAELESQMQSWIPGEGKSPDRIDALVHGLTALLIKPPPGFVGGRITARSSAGRRVNTAPSFGTGARGAFRVR